MREARYLLTEREERSALGAMRHAATSGNWQGAAYALEAEARMRAVIPAGEHWRLTVLTAYDGQEHETHAVVGFDSEGAVLADPDGWLVPLADFVREYPATDYAPEPYVYLWNAQVFTEAKAVSALTEQAHDALCRKAGIA